LILSCQAAAPLPSDLDAAVSTLTTAFAGAGFNSLNGKWGIFNVTACEVAKTNCIFNNPVTPYAFPIVPPNPNEPVHPFPWVLERIPGVSPEVTFRLTRTEAIVFIGSTPPPVTYYSFTPYVAFSFDGETIVPVFGSVADPINAATINTFDVANLTNPNPGPYNTGAVFVMTNSMDTATTLQNTIAAALGILPSQVNVLPLPTVLGPTPSTAIPMHYGLANYDDTFTMLLRVATQHDTQAASDYIYSSNFRVMRVFHPVEPATTTGFPYPTLRNRYGYNSEAPLQPVLNELINQTITNAAYRFDVVRININASNYPYNFGGSCYNTKDCLFETHDSHYFATHAFMAFEDPTEQLVMVGINHVQTGMGVYSDMTLTLYNGINLGVLSITNDQYAGSATLTVPVTDDGFDHKRDWNSWGNRDQQRTQTINVPEMYVYTLARSCPPLNPYCTEVPSQFENGKTFFPPDQPAVVLERIYQESKTLAGPAASLLDQPVVLKFIDRCRPIACDATGTCGNDPSSYTLQNIAFESKSVSQSSTAWNFDASLAVDASDFTMALTTVQTNPWWEIDLGFARRIESISLHGLIAFSSVLVSNTPFQGNSFQDAQANAQAVFDIGAHWESSTSVNVGGIYRYVRVQTQLEALMLRDVQIFSYCRLPGVN